MYGAAVHAAVLHHGVAVAVDDKIVRGVGCQSADGDAPLRGTDIYAGAAAKGKALSTILNGDTGARPVVCHRIPYDAHAAIGHVGDAHIAQSTLGHLYVVHIEVVIPAPKSNVPAFATVAR